VPNISVANTDLYYERRGAGEPLLLIQGLGGNSLHWGERFLSELEHEFELILYDHRGAGRSAALSGACTIAGLAADAAALLTALEVEAAHVVGISMGGMVAQELALSTPERVHTLTLGCTFPGGPEARMTDPAVVGQLADAILSGDAERALRVGYEVMIAPHYAEDPANYALYAEVAGLYRAPLQVLIAQLQAISGHDTSERLSEISVPTLVVHGTADRLLESVNGELVARLIPNSRLELLDGAGHMFFWEQPERAAALVREHASGVTAP
jgi:3-oxoadipate enol-lactonase